MMDGPWRESSEIHEDGLRHCVIKDFDARAFCLVLAIIHGKNREVPRTIDFPTLVEVAVVVDYIEFVPERLLWICVAGVFREEEIFESCTRVAITQSLAPIPTWELPILTRVNDKIDQRRQQHLDEILSAVYTHLDHLREEDTCSIDCNAMLLGTLTKCLYAGYLLPSLTAPYGELSVSGAVKTVNGLTVPNWVSKVKLEHGESTRSATPDEVSQITRTRVHMSDSSWHYGEVMELLEHKCGFEQLISEVNGLESKIKGLRLESDLGFPRAAK
ncbi:hypothetical protein F5Y19DRAFT_489195 [Xylariaceae sp. FL1651]|nr:hypothetical protein F5Y19DRAFT_489195 [Xylariaceae sp. FL1651]